MQKIACLFFISVFFIGCATAYKMNNVSVGMSKREVIDALGSPGSTAAEGNGGAEYLTYYLYATGNDAIYKMATPYFVKIVDGRVVSFGRAGDFDSTKDPTYNLNIKNR